MLCYIIALAKVATKRPPILSTPDRTKIISKQNVQKKVVGTELSIFLSGAHDLAPKELIFIILL